MEFQKALTSIKNNKRITRKSWNNREVYLCIRAGAFMIKLEDGTFHPCLLSELDIFADDWEVVMDS